MSAETPPPPPPDSQLDLQNKGQAPILIDLDQVQTLCVEWLWQNRIPQGMVSCVCGPPGFGKSVFTCWLGATVSTGRPFPGDPAGTLHEPGVAIFLSAAADLERTIKPRLIAAGA